MYNLTPNVHHQKRVGFSQLRRLFLFIAIALFILISILLIDTPGQENSTPAFDVMAYPTSTKAIIRTAWIEARDPCPQSREYEKQIAPGANLWIGEGEDKTPSGKLIRHATRVTVISKNKEWTHIEQNGVTGYVQSYLIVNYDPAKEFRPATGDRYEMVCG